MAMTWSQLAALQRALGSKALLALPVAAFVVAALPDEWVDVLRGNWRLHCVYWGSVLFLLGQAITWHQKPALFRNDTDHVAAVEQAKLFSSFDSFKNRRGMLENLLSRYTSRQPGDLSEAALQIGKARLEEAKAATEADWPQLLPHLVVAQRNLLDFDSPTARFCATITMGVGVVLLLVPTAWNVLVAGFVLLGRYFGAAP